LNPKNVMNRYVKRAARESGCAGINWHSFRHTFTVRQRKLKTHPKVVSSLLGHASVAVAMDSYDHLDAAELRQPLGDLLGDVMKHERRIQ
jgi:integrase